ncbi:MAG: hypothetical protein ABS79_03280 [Planctomycetes bacterium SCN 63-9]|nr:MAG: hypothetical protein ABS79_03280 [Planctomycetes bacterium SCN 63-9]
MSIDSVMMRGNGTLVLSSSHQVVFDFLLLSAITNFTRSEHPTWRMLLLSSTWQKRLNPIKNFPTLPRCGAIYSIARIRHSESFNHNLY